MECAETTSDLGPMEARLILEPYFHELRTRFVAAGFRQVSRTQLRCSHDLHDTPRHFAGCMQDGRIIYAAPELVELPEETVLGILAHELGHALDFLYPGEFLLRGDRVVIVQPDQQRLKGWKKRDADSVEVTADLIVEHVLGVPVGYRGPCLLQSLGAGGIRRPQGLR